MHDISPSLPPEAPDILGKLAEKLCAERASLNAFLEKRHAAILADVDKQLNLGQQCLGLSPATPPVANSPRRTCGPSGETLSDQLPKGDQSGSTCVPPATVAVQWSSSDRLHSRDSKSALTDLFTNQVPAEHSLRSNPTVKQVPAERGSCLARIGIVAVSDGFEAAFAFLIIVNSLVMAVELQYLGSDLGYKVGFPGLTRPASETWPGAEGVFYVLEFMFGIAFTLEVVVKMVGMRVGFVRSVWNWLDTIIIVIWMVSVAGSTVMNPMFLRLARFGRFLRLLRLLRTVQVFHVLHVLLGSLKASLNVLLWAILLLFFVMLTAAMVLNFCLEPYILNEDNPHELRMEAFLYFGTWSRGMLSLFELTLGNWIPITRFLHDDINEWFGPPLLCYQGLVGFAVVTVIRAIFLHETFQVAAQDDDLMIMKKERLVKQHIQKMERFFKEADNSGDGFLSQSEFLEVMADPRVSAWLGAMELDVHDAQLVFELVDDGDHQISAAELIQGFSRLKGVARSLDLVTMLQTTQHMDSTMRMISNRVEEIQRVVCEVNCRLDGVGA